eukprot:TRINITY_DN59531_c0_g1_i1.p1 TRINITY_DN59531_c0_g1~~TRINITY_DN59531_c0_g1_i1.p1  ORF type:complete len:231 (+),score=10.63 TRINITY_DN59531_c0_g1_i1:78-770(+)
MVLVSKFVFRRRLHVLANAYHHSIQSRPVITKCCTGGALSLLGDIGAQSIEACRNGSNSSVYQPSVGLLDWRRTFALSSISVWWTGLVNHHWYEFLDRLMPMATGKTRYVFAKVAINQFIMNPFIFLPCFYMWTGAIFGRSMDETIAKAQDEYWRVLTACWSTLGLGNVVMFCVLPVAYHAVFVSFVTFCHSIALSLISNRDRALVRTTGSSIVEQRDGILADAAVVEKS